MLSVAICDDEITFCRQIEDYVCRLSDSLHLPVEVKSYTSADALLKEPDPDILFLDIEIGDRNGIETARSIRARNQSMVIIFMTNHIQYAVEGYTVQAYRYLLKPITYAQFTAEVSVVFQNLRKKETVEIHAADGVHLLPPDRIRYIETLTGKRLAFHTRAGADELTLRDTLTPWEDRLGSGFFRVHSSFLINLDDVARIGKDTVLLTGGEEIPISRHRRKTFIEALTNHVKGVRF